MMWTRAVSSTALAVLLTGCATAPAQKAPSSAPAPLTADSPAPDTMRWLYGSGEAAGVSIQAMRQLADYAVTQSRLRNIPQSVPMGIGGTIRSESCLDGGRIKPLAVVFDVDETIVLNAGYEAWLAQGNTYSSESWRRWEERGGPLARPVPGAVTALRRLRDAGITPVFNTNRQHSPEGARQAIETAGLGSAVHRETLFLRGDDGSGGSGKDGRRAAIASRYCVIALAGDNLGDFADLFNAPTLSPQERRELAARGEYAQLWGAGWFALPNPAYGDSLKGTIREVFGKDADWSPQPGDAPPIANEGSK